MRFSQRTVGERSVLDLIPVVNVVLLLMFFFLLSWSFVLQPGVEVRLPSPGFSGMTQRGRHVITLKNGAQGEMLIFFDEKVVLPAELKRCLVESSKKHYAEWITLNADEGVSHGGVQQVVAWATEQGFKVAIATQRALKTPSNGAHTP
ncbi:MAG: biopolymer transporter ExbD [Verrucomicrobiae bacterium]|nr:biopolymer transporter ExbD [Verrucomicrobiae bacterium]